MKAEDISKRLHGKIWKLSGENRIIRSCLPIEKSGSFIVKQGFDIEFIEEYIDDDEPIILLKDLIKILEEGKMTDEEEPESVEEILRRYKKKTKEEMEERKCQ